MGLFILHCDFVVVFDRYVFLFDKVLLMCKARVLFASRFDVIFQKALGLA